MNPYNLLLERAADSPDKTAFLSRAAGEVTFSQLAERVTRLANALKQSGLGKGDVIATLLPNCMEMVDLYIAAGAVGAVFQPLDFRFQGEEIALTGNNHRESPHPFKALARFQLFLENSSPGWGTARHGPAREDEEKNT